MNCGMFITVVSPAIAAGATGIGGFDAVATGVSTAAAGTRGAGAGAGDIAGNS